jgi:hypothetical protein
MGLQLLANARYGGAACNPFSKEVEAGGSQDLG